MESFQRVGSERFELSQLSHTAPGHHCLLEQLILAAGSKFVPLAQKGG
jgi:hypothetical protein